MRFAKPCVKTGSRRLVENRRGWLSAAADFSPDPHYTGYMEYVSACRGAARTERRHCTPNGVQRRAWLAKPDGLEDSAPWLFPATAPPGWTSVPSN